MLIGREQGQLKLVLTGQLNNLPESIFNYGTNYHKNKLHVLT